MYCSSGSEDEYVTTSEGEEEEEEAEEEADVAQQDDVPEENFGAVPLGGPLSPAEVFNNSLGSCVIAFHAASAFRANVAV